MRIEIHCLDIYIHAYGIGIWELLDVSVLRECEQGMDRMFVLTEIEFRHQIGANSVMTCMGSIVDCMGCMWDMGTIWERY